MAGSHTWPVIQDLVELPRASPSEIVRDEVDYLIVGDKVLKFVVDLDSELDKIWVLILVLEIKSNNPHYLGPMSCSILEWRHEESAVCAIAQT